MLVTGDSLGLFLGLAMGKRVLALFGPTSPGQHGPHERLRTLTPEIKRDCLPCFKAGCVYPDPCMGHIAPRQVMDAIEAWGVA
jgi:ADP-heptose:LPS heptosyltransferase